MNSTFVHLVVRQALAGPYLGVPAMSKHSALLIANGRFTNFFSHFLFTSALLKLKFLDTTFRNFQNSAILLSREDGCPLEGGRWVHLDGWGSASADLKGCQFQSCYILEGSGDKMGGAILSKGYALSVVECGFFDCMAATNGGAIAATGTGDGWIGSWYQKQGLPGVKIDRACFQQCRVRDMATGVDEVGHVLFAYSVQIGIFDFSALDCSMEGSKRAALFFARCNDFLTERGNMSLSSAFTGGDVSAFQILYVGEKIPDGQKRVDGSWTGIPAAIHRFHHTSGFQCEHVYSANLNNGLSSHVLENIDVIDTTLVDGETSHSAIFYAWKSNGDGSGHELQIRTCNVFDVVHNSGKFYRLGPKNWEYIPITPKISNCLTNVQAWEERQNNIVIEYSQDSYTPNTFKMENELYCIWKPTEPPLETETETATEEPLDTRITTEEPFESDGPSSFDVDTFTVDTEIGPATQTDESDTEDSGIQNRGLPPGAIAGIVIGIFLVIAIILILIFLLRPRKISSSGSSQHDNEMESEGATITATTETSYPLVTTTNYNETQINQIFELSDSIEPAPFESGIEEAI